MRPASSGSSRFTHRSSVDLPEPEAPIRQTTSWFSSSRSIPRSTSFAPNDLRTPSNFNADSVSSCPGQRVDRSFPTDTQAEPARPEGGTASGASCEPAGRLAPLPVAGNQPVGEARQRNRDCDEERRGGEVGAVREGRIRVDLRLVEGFDDAERPYEGGVLLQADEVVQQRRDHPADRLRQDHPAQRLEAREAQGARGRLLARVYRLDSGPVDLRHVAAVDEDQSDPGPEDTRGRHAAQL